MKQQSLTSRKISRCARNDSLLELSKLNDNRASSGLIDCWKKSLARKLFAVEGWTVF
jgi:hypothetical protein